MESNRGTVILNLGKAIWDVSFFDGQGLRARITLLAATPQDAVDGSVLHLLSLGVQATELELLRAAPAPHPAENTILATALRAIIVEE